MAILTPEIQTYLTNIWFPKALITGLNFLAFIVPKSVFAELSMKNANKDVEKKSEIEIKYFTSETSAFQWLLSK